MERVDSRLWRLVLAGIGVALVGSAFYPTVFRGPQTGETILSNPFRFVLTVGPGALVVVTGLQLDRLELDEDLLGRIVGWCLVGVAIFTGIILLVAGMTYYSTGTSSLTGFSLQLGAGVGGITGTVVGVSEVRAISRARVAARERAAAEAAEEQRETLVFLNSLLRHHVLNGLQIIRGNAELLQMEYDPDYAETIVERSDSIVTLVKNVRALVEADNAGPPPQPVDLAEVVRREATAIGETYPEAIIDVDIPPHLSIAADQLVTAVFENLIRNAIEHNDSDTPKVRIEATRTDGTVRVNVSDNGPGIENPEQAFMPGDSGSRGIGLHLVETLVSRYDGEITVSSDDDGTTFVVTLPTASSTEDGGRATAD